MVVFRDRAAARLRQEARDREAGDTLLDYQKANASTVGAISTRVSTIENGLGAGFIDYTDLDAGTAWDLPADTPLPVSRNLAASEANRRLSGPWRFHEFWDNDDKLVRSRALYDTFGASNFIRVIQHKLNTVLRVSYIADGLEFAAVNMPLTATVGSEESIRANFPDIPTRSRFFENGAQIVLRATAPVTIVEFSPEFFPQSYEL